MELLKALYLTASVLGAFVCLSLLGSSYKNLLANRTLSLCIFLILVSPLTSYLYLAGVAIPHWLIALTQAAILLYGPLAFVFINQLTRHPLSRKVIAFHAAPFAILFFAKSLSIYTDNLVGLVLYFGLVIFYGIYNCVLVFQRRSYFKILHGEYRNTAYFWLSYVVYSLFALTLIKSFLIIAFLTGRMPAVSLWQGIELLLCFYIFTVAGFSLWQPKVFFNNNDSLTTLDASNDQPLDFEGSVKETGQCNVARSAKDKFDNRQLELDDALADTLKRELLLLIKNHHPERDNELTLESLAKLMGLRSNQMSELLNVHMATSFYHFINQQRLQLALPLLQDNGCRLSILDIAYEAGFNNKNTFYKTFKLAMGVTPSQYRRSKSAVTSLA